MLNHDSIQKVIGIHQGDDTARVQQFPCDIKHDPLTHVADYILPPALTIQILTRNIEERRSHDQLRICLDKPIKVMECCPFSFFFSLVDAISRPICTLAIS